MAPHADEAVDALGMPIRLHYQLFALFAVVMGGVPLLLSFTPIADPVTHIWLLRAVCACPFLLAWGYLVAGRRADWAVDLRIYHVAGFATVALLVVASPAVPRLIGAMAALLLIVPVTAAYVAPTKPSLLHLGIGSVVLVVLALIATPQIPLLRVVTLEIVMFAGFFMVVTTKSHMVAALDRLRAQATIDSLTGAANVRAMREALESEIARAARGGAGFSLISFDLDDFKSSNDRYSHATGDQVLRAVATAVQSRISERDMLVRRGGDEFSVIVPAVPGQSVDSLCSEIAIAIARVRLSVCPDVLPTASIGWADHLAGETPDELLARVDDAVHDAKVRSREQDLSLLDIATDAEMASARSVIRAEDETIEAEDPTATATLFAWRQAAILYVVVAVVYTALAATGRTPLDLNWAGAVAVTFTALLAPVALALSKRERVSIVLTHVLAAVSIGLIFSIALINLDAAGQTADLFLVAIFFVMFLLPTRQAAAYALACIGLMALTLILNSESDWLLRTIFALVSGGLVSIILALSRHRTIATTAASAQLARIDPLTELSNVRRLRECINREIRRSEASGNGFSLIMLDLDDFKLVNDLHGHSHGDQVLVAVADALRENVRQSEMPARRGGDEFAVVLTDPDPAAAIGAMDRLARAIENVRQELSADVLPTASLGSAEWRDGDDADALMKRADAALHESKMLSHSVRGILDSGLEAHSAPREG